MAVVTLEHVRKHPKVKTFITKANEYLKVIGFTEHGFRHTELVARVARKILLELAYSEREAELAAIAGYLHDIGNVICRPDHDKSGALIALSILEELGMPYEEIADVIVAIGNHDEQQGKAVNSVSAALILADKSDVHRGRVRNPDFSTFDIHDRVNYAVKESVLNINAEERVITLELKIDTRISQVMEYFEIFLSRMIMCRRAASFLDARFGLVINGAVLL
ncbi:MAG: HD domain-containing protein [Dethiobacteria bacterium]